MEKLEPLTILRFEASYNYLPSVLEGRNSEVFRNILRFFAPPPKKVLDLTAGFGKFYEKIDRTQYDITMCDCRHLPNIDVVCDCRNPPFKENSFDVIVLDPPYQHVGTKAWKRTGKGIFHYNYSKIPNQKYMMTLFNDKALSSILKPEGILIIKIMDMIESSKPNWNHMKIVDILPSFKLEDLIIYKYRAIQDPKWKRIYHARKCHAYFMIFIKKEAKWKRE